MQDMSKNFVNYGFLLESLINIKKMHSSRVIAGYNTAVFYIKNEANRITIRNGPRQIALILRVISPTALIIEKLNMFYRGYRFVASEGNPTTVFLPDGNVWFKTNGMRMIGNAHGIVIEGK